MFATCSLKQWVYKLHDRELEEKRCIGTKKFTWNHRLDRYIKHHQKWHHCMISSSQSGWFRHVHQHDWTDDRTDWEAASITTSVSQHTVCWFEWEHKGAPRYSGVSPEVAKLFSVLWVSPECSAPPRSSQALSGAAALSNGSCSIYSAVANSLHKPSPWTSRLVKLVHWQ